MEIPFMGVEYQRVYAFDEVAEKIYIKMHNMTIRTAILRENCDKFGYSARVIHKLLRMARTAADVRGSANIEKEDIIKVLGCRELDKSNSQMYTV